MPHAGESAAHHFQRCGSLGRLDSALSHDEPAPYGGQVGPITYKAAADFDDFHAYMP